MSGQLRNLKNRIRSVESTKKITRAMEMVAASKLRRFEEMTVRARPFMEGLQALIEKLRANAGSDFKPVPTHPFFEKREEKNTALVLITSDTGLCGYYNTDLVQRARVFLGDRRAGTGLKSAPTLIAVGKSGITALKRMGLSATHTFTDTRASRVEEILEGLTATLKKIYLNQEIDAAYVIYSHFLTVTTYQGVTEKLLPLETSTPPSIPSRGGLRWGADVDYIFEPSPERIFQKLVPLFFEARIRQIFLESFVSEQIARMRAMHQATDNATEMVDSLVLLRNKARQASITKEIIEIVSGSRALKIK